jgi:hypothetical protein
MCWLGFIATTSLGMVLWEGKSWKLYAINIGYYFVTFIIGGLFLLSGINFYFQLDKFK